MPTTCPAASSCPRLGGVGYYLLAGKPMFTGTTVLELACRHLYTNPIAPSERRGSPIASELEALSLACLAKDPTDRSHALTEKLTHLSHRHPWGAAESTAWWRAWRRQRHAVARVSGPAKTRDGGSPIPTEKLRSAPTVVC